MTGRRTWVGLLVAVALALLLWWQSDGSTPGAEPAPTPNAASDAPTTGATDPVSGLPVVALADLPAEAADTLARIDAGGPYPYDQDDGVFMNREGLLPEQPQGYYREYTVETPGSEDRGARRIVTGDGGELYWTDDHYASYSVIRR